jgi:hypothetical protein
LGRALEPRVVRSGRYYPSAPLTGDDSNYIYRKSNLITIGQNGRYFETVYSGEGNLDEDLQLVQLTGTLSLTDGSQTVIGTGTALFSECHLGESILGISSDGLTSWLLKPKQIISDTEMVVWQAPDETMSGVTIWAMPRLNADQVSRQTCLTGNGMRTDKGNYFGAGSGVVRTNGSPFTASWTLAKEPSLNLFAPATDTYTNFPLGMDTPTGVTAAAVGGGTKDMQGGSYSLVVTPNRKETGGYNNPSLRVDVTIATGDKVRITFPAMDTANGQNAWGVWVTPFRATLGADLQYLEGPWFFYIVVTDTDVSSAGGTFDIEWLDAEVVVNELVSFNNEPPTDAEGVALLNNTPVWWGCQGQGASTNPTQTNRGPFICPAKPTNVEAAPLELSFSSSPAEIILGVVSAQGRLYLLTANHLQIAQSTPDPAVPILIRPFWKDGFTGPDQLVFVNGNLYGYPVAGPSRSVGEGDEIEAERDWAADVAEITKNWNPGHVIVGYDPFRDMVVFIHCADHRNEAGYWTSRMLGYGISQGFWVFDGLLTSDEEDQIVSGIATVADRLELVIGGRGTETPLEQVTGDSAMSFPALQWTADGEVHTPEIDGDAVWVFP